MISCTCLSLYFLHLFSNFIQVVPVVLTPVQLGTFLIFWKIFMSCFISFLLSTGLFLGFYNAICYTHCMMVLWNYSNLLYSSPGPGSTRDQLVAITKATTDWTMQDLRPDPEWRTALVYARRTKLKSCKNIKQPLVCIIKDLSLSVFPSFGTPSLKTIYQPHLPLLLNALYWLIIYLPWWAEPQCIR